MQCPIDQTTLAITERQGIEIDYCPQCRGVWLDRGELDKLIDATSSSTGFASSEPQRMSDAPRPDDRSYDRGRNIHDSDDPSYKHGRKRKKGGFLGELFDF